MKPKDLDALRRFDTPTVCNALEAVAPERRATGFTTRPLVCAVPDLPLAGDKPTLAQVLADADAVRARLHRAMDEILPQAAE